MISIYLFFIGLLGAFLSRKNFILCLMSLELMLLAINMNFVFFSLYTDTVFGQISTFFILVVGACESAIGLALIVVYYKGYRLFLKNIIFFFYLTLKFFFTDICSINNRCTYKYIMEKKININQKRNYNTNGIPKDNNSNNYTINNILTNIVKDSEYITISDLKFDSINFTIDTKFDFAKLSESEQYNFLVNQFLLERYKFLQIDYKERK